MDATPREYFYFMSAIGPGRAPTELAGIVTLTPDATRIGVYGELRERAAAGFGCRPEALVVTAFTLEPNKIGD